ncbi:MAG TPA: pyrroloquinoline quinone biosynthesis protein PqqB [Polyangiaceae bacterium]|jgi:pyrroloquinoline quinone biosynthesis protein B|nr:pyrroloquinoline quinone biosynthesis protein PqqB [Polyangiaceae bacterium]
MRVEVLGSGAGGGLPQWNCGCDNCTLVRAGDRRVAARTQDSIAIGGDAAGAAQLLVNASPDVLRHIERSRRLWPRGPRDTPIGAIALTNGDLDHVIGLLSLRESQPLRILATRRVRDGLVERNAVLRTLARTPDQVTWTELELGREVVLDDVGVGVTPLPVAGKLPVHLVGLLDPSSEDNVALRVRDLASGRTVVVATALGSLDGIDALVAGADAILLDGTFWRDDELIALGLGRARAQDMAHVPVGGAAGSIARLAQAKIAGARRVFTHINNTNPILRADSPERAEVERAGWEIAFDGMEIAV